MSPVAATATFADGTSAALRSRVMIHDNVHNDAGQNRNRDSRGDDQGGSLSHRSSAPLAEVEIACFTTTGTFSKGEYAMLHSIVV